MKHSRFLAAFSVAASMSFFLLSCNSGGGKTDKQAVEEITATVKDTAAAKPLKLLIIQHKVVNFTKWLPGYEGHDSVRLASGLHSFIIGRGMEDSNMVVIMFKMDDVNKAMAMTNSPELKEVMQKAGVVSKPTFTFLDIVMIDTSKIEQAARVMVTHHVKDFDAWKKGFDEHKSIRVAAGLIDRGVGYSDGDNHVATAVFAVTDMKKAKEFMNSKDLKEKMEKSGVDGPPTFFMYNVVKKY